MTKLQSSYKIDPFINFEEEILKLKKKLNAVILAHYYQDSDIQEIADFVGDSLDLSKKAASTSADIIIFCGVKFMAEAALILNPNKKVLIPDLLAGCSLEQSCPAPAFKAFKDEHPNHLAITYINCSAEIKALSDIIVTSTNAEKIIHSIPINQPIIFAPDKHLGSYLIKKTGRKMILWNGSCIVHENFSERELIKLKNTHAGAKIIAHPECPTRILDYAEFIGSTSALINYTKAHQNNDFIVLTEPGIIHQMRKTNNSSNFYEVPSLNSSGCASCSNCPFMKLNTIEKLYLCMLNQEPEIKLPYDLIQQAYTPLARMLKLSS